MINALVRVGTPTGEGSGFYGMIANNWQEIVERVKRVGIDYEKSKWQDDYWDEFKGTFDEGDTRVYGVRVKLVLLDESLVEYVYAGSIGELISEVTR